MWWEGGAKKVLALLGPKFSFGCLEGQSFLDDFLRSLLSFTSEWAAIYNFLPPITPRYCERYRERERECMCARTQPTETCATIFLRLKPNLPSHMWIIVIINYQSSMYVCVDIVVRWTYAHVSVLAYSQSYGCPCSCSSPWSLLLAQDTNFDRSIKREIKGEGRGGVIRKGAKRNNRSKIKT